MSEEMQIDGKSYISSKRAAELSGYAQDYIGQLSRKGLVDARRVGGLWYVSMESLLAYQKKAEEFKPEPPSRKDIPADPETLVFFDGKEYLSAARAAQVTGYAQDYVGQLARSGTILSQQVGNRWYVEKQSITRHKSEKDHMLGALQSESVGLAKPKTGRKNPSEYLSSTGYSGAGPLLNYFNEDDDLIPIPASKGDDNKSLQISEGESFSTPKPAPAGLKIASGSSLPIRRVREYQLQPPVAPRGRQISVGTHPAVTKSTLPLLLGAVATIIIVLSVGYASVLKQNSAYAVNIQQIGSLSALPASVAVAFERLGDILEPYLTHDISYQSFNAQY